MISTGMKANIITYNTLLTGLFQGGKVDSSKTFSAEMQVLKVV